MLNVSRVVDFWHESGGDKLLADTSFQEMFNSLSDKDNLFSLTDRNLRCIDEGTPGGIHMAGSGILNPNVLSDLKGKINGVFSHQDCEVVIEYISENQLSIFNIDEYADRKAKELAGILGISYLGRISLSEMERIEGFHFARAVYYDGTGSFNPARDNSFPKGFVISRKYYSDHKIAQRELELAIKIAFGEHGFGDFFTKRAPLFLVAVSSFGGDNILVETLKQELETVASRYKRVKIDQINYQN